MSEGIGGEVNCGISLAMHYQHHVITGIFIQSAPSNEKPRGLLHQKRDVITQQKKPVK
ncbi:hypothetical protein [Pantoea vagans]|uniref:hypothetical protein n=1 Tax=Pantoea vagans TaxID=470934 RepID=UPI0028E8A05D|nr:hypothetical protein [Pantoea vagans]